MSTTTTRLVFFFTAGLGLIGWFSSTLARAGRISNGYTDADLELISEVPDSTGINAFGISVAINNGVALVGASGERNTGQAHLYNSHTAQLLTTLVPDKEIPGDAFGRHVALDKSYALVSSLQGTHVYDLATYEQLYILPETPGHLSWSHAIDVELGHAVIATATESVVYDLASGERLAAFNGRAGTMSISGDSVIIGDYRNDSVSVYNWKSGLHLFDLSPGNLPESTRFGVSVDAYDARVVVVATGVPGSAYVFDLTNGKLIHELQGSHSLGNTQSLSSFGGDVVINGSIAIVAAYRLGDSLLLDGEELEKYELNQGAAYAFALDSGEQVRKFTTLGPQTGGWAQYGFSIDYDGQQVIAGIGFGGWPKKAFLTTFVVPEPRSFVLLVAGTVCAYLMQFHASRRH